MNKFLQTGLLAFGLSASTVILAQTSKVPALDLMKKAETDLSINYFCGQASPQKLTIDNKTKNSITWFITYPYDVQFRDSFNAQSIGATPIFTYLFISRPKTKVSYTFSYTGKEFGTLPMTAYMTHRQTLKHPHFLGNLTFACAMNDSDVYPENKGAGKLGYSFVASPKYKVSLSGTVGDVTLTIYGRKPLLSLK